MKEVTRSENPETLDIFFKGLTEGVGYADVRIRS